eukprot:3152355-Rhodomonas_salina.1
MGRDVTGVDGDMTGVDRDVTGWMGMGMGMGRGRGAGGAREEDRAQRSEQPGGGRGPRRQRSQAADLQADPGRARGERTHVPCGGLCVYASQQEGMWREDMRGGQGAYGAGQEERKRGAVGQGLEHSHALVWCDRE